MSILEGTDRIGIYKFVSDIIDSQAYVLLHEKQALIFDPIETNEFMDFIQGKFLQEATVILTHEHFDHIRGVNFLKSYMKTIVYASEATANAIKLPDKNLSNYANVLLSFYDKKNIETDIILPYTCSADVIIEDGKLTKWNLHVFETIYTPGHSRGSACFLMDDKYLFSGDTVLTMPTITRFPGGSKKDFLNVTLPRLEKLRNRGIVVFPGHGEAEYLDCLLDDLKLI